MELRLIKALIVEYIMQSLNVMHFWPDWCSRDALDGFNMILEAQAVQLDIIHG